MSKDAFAAKILGDGQVWIEMLDHRNLLSHTYNFESFEEAVEAIGYLSAIGMLHTAADIRRPATTTICSSGRRRIRAHASIPALFRAVFGLSGILFDPVYRCPIIPALKYVSYIHL